MAGLSVWARVIRIRFLFASFVAVTTGLTISLRDGFLEPYYALATYLGVLSLHASVDLLNDYFDYKSGIDLLTVKTPFSGGTGVLPEGALSPVSVYRAGIFFLLGGAAVGILLAIMRGFLVIPLLLLATLSAYFYSTRLANYGIGEFFIAIKGMLIVVGTYYVQTISITAVPLYAGAILGLLSASVVFLNEFPDYEADKAKQRRNLIVRLGRERAAEIFIIFPLAVFSLIVAGVLTSILPPFSLLSIVVTPNYLKVYRKLSLSKNDPAKLIPIMADNIIASRVTGLVIAAAFILPIFSTPLPG